MPMVADILPIATVTTSTGDTGAFWFATSHHELGPDRAHPANTAIDIVSALASLVRVTETGSLSAVAREQDVSKAAVARQISFLEHHFGVRLLHRTTRKLSLADDGQTLLGLAASRPWRPHLPPR
jgi:Bacterial regulatory helix-turn-helix protein, lysR family